MMKWLFPMLLLFIPSLAFPSQLYIFHAPWDMEGDIQRMTGNIGCPADSQIIEGYNFVGMYVWTAQYYHPNGRERSSIPR